jgi:DNA-binding NtrC family response regulator
MAKKAILIVDDEPTVRNFVREVLEETGYIVKEASDVDHAMALLEDDGIGAIVADIEMSGWPSVIGFAWMVRALWPSIPVIAAAAPASLAELKLPANTPLLIKPLCPDRLREVMSRVA